MSNNCTNPPADSLVVGTMIGVDCDGNPIGAGANIATCKDLKEVKDDVDDLDFATHEEVDAVEFKADKALGHKILRVEPNGDKRDIILDDGSRIPFNIGDTNPVVFEDVRVNAFATEGDNLVITTSDGIKHDLTRQEFADWLASKDSPMATDEELLEALAGLDDLQPLIDKLQAQVDGLSSTVVVGGRFIDVTKTTSGGRDVYTVNGENYVEFLDETSSNDLDAAPTGREMISIIGISDSATTNTHPQEDIPTWKSDGNGVIMSVASKLEVFQIVADTIGDKTNFAVRGGNAKNSMKPWQRLITDKDIINTEVVPGTNVTVEKSTTGQTNTFTINAAGSSGGASSKVNTMTFADKTITLNQTIGDAVKVEVPVNYISRASGTILGGEFIDFPRTSPLPADMKGIKEEGADPNRAENRRWWINTGLRMPGRTQQGRFFANIKQSGIIESPDEPADQLKGGWWEEVECRVISFWSGPHYLYIEVIPRLGPNMTRYDIDSLAWEVFELKEGVNL